MPGTAILTIRMKKMVDGGSSLSCERADDSVTWQRHEGATARFFPRHDITHYVVETVLGHRRGFYGLVAEGWELSDFGTPWPRGPLPPEAQVSERVVGLLDVERSSGAVWTAEQFAEALATRALPGAAGHPPITDDQLATIRERRAELFARWDAVPPGEILELVFDL